MTNTRRTRVLIEYQGVDITTELEDYLSNFVFSDNEGRADEIQIDLQDKRKRWQKPWLPGDGDIIKATIKTYNWNKRNEVLRLRCGTFYVDDVSFKGPPDSVSIKAVSVPFAAGGKDTKRSRAWEDVSLNTIAGDIAVASKLALIYDAPNVYYDRVDQSKETDLGFLKRLAKKEGLSIKVTNDQLVVYHQLTYEKKKAVRTITRGDSDVLSWDFSKSAAEKQYKKVEITYFDAAKKKKVKYTYDVPDVAEGPTLKLNRRAKTIAEAKRWAIIEARNKNKNGKVGKLTMAGAIDLVQGLTIDIKNFGAFDGKYIIESCSHNPTGKYEVNLDIRGVLKY
ncbi:phage late control D family protein [Sporosarcina sp. P33]|uniref:phage late control D family protein n=1 Tax=Sporosarcina sp. P33 TaxID=1930764 RepID=UPI0009C1B070|nr:contractile injection system protein, VgrG/Pvc8 family [Sporosarcina sp. P33]ARD47570.1 hypothetical protein SporoP33_04505 [Sporosarcina sp. P33]